MTNPNAQPMVERAQLVLGNQPPLPGNAAIRMVQPNEEEYDGALVPTTPYYEEEPEMGHFEVS